MTNPFPAPCCAGYEFIFRLLPKNKSVLHADGLYKVSVTHLPPPGLPRFGGGERPPFLCKPPAPLTITMGRRLIFRPIKVLTALRCPKKSSHYSFARFFRPLRILRLASSATGGARLRIPNHRDPPPPQVLTYPEHQTAALHLPAHPGPFPAIGKGGGGKGQMLPQATLGAILCAVRIDFRLPSKINPYPAQPATGVLGQRPKRILPTFVRTKVGPRRAGVQIKT